MVLLRYTDRIHGFLLEYAECGEHEYVAKMLVLKPHQLSSLLEKKILSVSFDFVKKLVELLNHEKSPKKVHIHDVIQGSALCYPGDKSIRSTYGNSHIPGSKKSPPKSVLKARKKYEAKLYSSIISRNKKSTYKDRNPFHRKNFGKHWISQFGLGLDLILTMLTLGFFFMLGSYWFGLGEYKIGFFGIGCVVGLFVDGILIIIRLNKEPKVREVFRYDDATGKRIKIHKNERVAERVFSSTRDGMEIGGNRNEKKEKIKDL